MLNSYTYTDTPEPDYAPGEMLAAVEAAIKKAASLRVPRYLYHTSDLVEKENSMGTPALYFLDTRRAVAVIGSMGGGTHMDPIGDGLIIIHPDNEQWLLGQASVIGYELRRLRVYHDIEGEPSE
jgi:hypothetical protein